MMDETIPKIAEVIVTLFLGILAFIFTQSFRSQIKQKTVDRRLEAYPALWEYTWIAAPTRMKSWHRGEQKGPLTLAEREQLYTQFTKWYYEKGNGIYLSDRTRRLYLTVKDNLICPDEELKPTELYIIIKKLPAEERSKKRGEISIRQLSLMRARMRADLEVFGSLFFGELRDEDKFFLEYCGENLQQKPWRRQQHYVHSKGEE
ncbi:MAG TPA: hypothetical protein VLH08_20935 [Acidobacteriota bacterium]|nr:hypothetical protein [Acidobacteriota bacterium]